MKGGQEGGREGGREGGTGKGEGYINHLFSLLGAPSPSCTLNYYFHRSFWPFWESSSLSVMSSAGQ